MCNINMCKKDVVSAQINPQDIDLAIFLLLTSQTFKTFFKCWNHFRFLLKLWDTNTQNFHIPFTQIPQMLTFYHICFDILLFLWTLKISYMHDDDSLPEMF